METVKNISSAEQFKNVVDAFVAVKDTHENKQSRKQRSNRRYRQTAQGWLRNYYSRLKSRANEVAQIYTPADFVEWSKMSSSFRAAWGAYVDNGFKKDFAPKFLSFVQTDKPNTAPAYFYA